MLNQPTVPPSALALATAFRSAINTVYERGTGGSDVADGREGRYKDYNESEVVKALEVVI